MVQQPLFGSIQNSLGIYINPKLETTQISINRKVDKWIVAYLYNGRSLNCRKNELIIHKTTWKNLRNIKLNKRSQTQKSTYYIIPFI